MSARIEKLKTLLGRVQARRAEPRLRAVPAPLARAPAAAGGPPEPAVAKAPAPAAFPAETPSSRVSALPPERLSKPPKPTPLEDAMAGFAQPKPTEPKPAAAPAPQAPAARNPPSTELVLDDFDLGPSPAPAAAAAPAPQPAPAPRAEKPVDVPLTAATARVSPAAPEASTAVTRLVSQAQVQAPKSFGELLDLSLSLRPR